MRYHIVWFLLLLLTANSCRKDEPENPVACSLVGSIDGERWCGQVFEIFEDDRNYLVINASRRIDSNVGDQITIYVPDFHGTGTYTLQSEGAVYRKWCCGDLLLELAILDLDQSDSGQVLIEVYNEQTNEIRGTFYFTANNERQINVSGIFFGMKE